VDGGDRAAKRCCIPLKTGVLAGEQKSCFERLSDLNPLLRSLSSPSTTCFWVRFPSSSEVASQDKFEVIIRPRAGWKKHKVDI